MLNIKHDWEKIICLVSSIGNQESRLEYDFTLFRMLIAAEDHRFYNHQGVDVKALIRAFWRSIFCGRREGGSTVAMQLVRVLRNRYELSLLRKLTEIILALKLTSEIGRQRVLHAYLSVAYFGSGMVGIDQTCDRLELDPTSLADREAAALIARLKYPQPKRRSLSHDVKILARVEYILRRFEKHGKGIMNLQSIGISEHAAF